MLRAFGVAEPTRALRRNVTLNAAILSFAPDQAYRTRLAHRGTCREIVRSKQLNAREMLRQSCTNLICSTIELL
jgi:hypothetical protein